MSMFKFIKKAFSFGNNKLPDVWYKAPVPKAVEQDESEQQYPLIIAEQEEKAPVWVSNSKAIISDKYTHIQVAGTNLVSDPSAWSTVLPTLFVLKLPKPVVSSVNFLRRATHTIATQCNIMSGLQYAVVAAPVEKSVRLTVESKCPNSRVSAVFIAQGKQLLYRLEIEITNPKSGEVSMEYVTYDVTGTISFYSQGGCTVSFY